VSVRGLRAVVFDVDGTLVDSEQGGHRIAFNEAFAAFGLPDRWDRATYRSLLRTTGGERRLRAWFADPRSPSGHLHPETAATLASELHRYKTARFVAMAASGRIELRPGVPALLEHLDAAGVCLAVATTGHPGWVRPLLDAHFGPGRFACVVTAEDVTCSKPAPDAYLVALERLGIAAESAVAVEDSAPGLASARRAGLATAVVANQETDLAALDGAPLVVSAYGGDGPAMRVLVDRHGVATGRDRLDLALLDALRTAVVADEPAVLAVPAKLAGTGAPGDGPLPPSTTPPGEGPAGLGS